MAQCPATASGDPAVISRLDACESNIALLNGRVRPHQRVLAVMAENQVRTASRRPADDYYTPVSYAPTPVSLRDDPPPASARQRRRKRGRWSKGEWSSRRGGSASIRLPLPGTGGMIAIGTEPAGHAAARQSPADDGYYRQPTQRIPLRQASYRRSPDYNPFEQ